MKSRIPSKLVFAGCVWCFNRARNGVCVYVLVEESSRRLPWLLLVVLSTYKSCGSLERRLGMPKRFGYWFLLSFGRSGVPTTRHRKLKAIRSYLRFFFCLTMTADFSIHVALLSHTASIIGHAGNKKGIQQAMPVRKREYIPCTSYVVYICIYEHIVLLYIAHSTTYVTMVDIAAFGHCCSYIHTCGQLVCDLS